MHLQHRRALQQFAGLAADNRELYGLAVCVAGAMVAGTDAQSVPSSATVAATTSAPSAGAASPSGAAVAIPSCVS